MASRETEKVHEVLLQQLLDNSGLECTRPQPESTESPLSEEIEEIGPEEEEPPPPEAEPEEEEATIKLEEVPEELPEIFPTPSLRRVLPDKIRKIEDQNRIHVLPAEFKKDIDPLAIPKIATTPPQKYIDIIAELVGCTMYKSSLPEYWFLDTMANLLRRAQQDGLHRPTQAVLMLWFCEWMKEMQHFDAADRPRMLRRFQDTMMAAAHVITEFEYLPTPAQAGVYYKAVEEKEEDHQSTAPSNPVQHLVTFGETSYECSLMDLTKIIHYIYDLFSTDFQFDLVRSIFTHTPEHVLIDGPYQIQTPKTQYGLTKTKAKKDKPKKAEGKATPVKGKKKDAGPELVQEYIQLMELKAREERYLEELADIEQEVWNRKSSILPLSLADNEELFMKYWPPPPPPPEPEVIAEPEPVKKGKSGKGKGKN